MELEDLEERFTSCIQVTHYEPQIIDVSLEKLIFKIETQHEGITEEELIKILEDIEDDKYTTDLVPIKFNFVLTLVTNDGVEIILDE